jgi:hypothetical protein
MCPFPDPVVHRASRATFMIHARPLAFVAAPLPYSTSFLHIVCLVLVNVVKERDGTYGNTSSGGRKILEKTNEDRHTYSTVKLFHVTQISPRILLM